MMKWLDSVLAFPIETARHVKRILTPGEPERLSEFEETQPGQGTLDDIGAPFTAEQIRKLKAWYREGMPHKSTRHTFLHDAGVKLEQADERTFFMPFDPLEGDPLLDLEDRVARIERFLQL